MPFEKGQPRPANSGRKPGSRNKINRDVAERLAELRCDLVEGLVTIAQDVSAPVAVRARCYAELLEYVSPKLSRHEVVGPIGVGGAVEPIKLQVEYINKPTPE